MNQSTLILLGFLCSLIFSLGEAIKNKKPLEKHRQYPYIKLYEEKNVSAMATGLTEIIKGHKVKSLVILVNNSTIKPSKINEFAKELHRENVQSCIFYDKTNYFDYVQASLEGSTETTSIIFSTPADMVEEIQDRNLAHRLALYVFYWGLKKVHASSNWNLKEPLRVVIVTNPRSKVFRVYYNQATSSREGALTFVNWFDGNGLGLYKEPLLPHSAEVYKNFYGRLLYVPVIHTPPWFFVSYNNKSDSNETSEMNFSFSNNTQTDMQVEGGRDDRLLKLLAKKMNFQLEYVDSPDRSQGSSLGTAENNLTFTGMLGMLQRREADLVLGDITLNWERRKAVEFSFFTLADSGAFATHSPRKLNEALILVRPFRYEVWPPVIMTVLLSGPVLYLIISIPIWWRKRIENREIVANTFYMEYLQEMNYGVRNVAAVNNFAPVGNERLLNKCIWFTMNVYLRQSAEFHLHGHRVRFLIALFWLVGTYVLGDVYSAQLTSQLARPAKEAPINTLRRLETAMQRHGYELKVERESASQSLLENGTGIYRSLYKMMIRQHKLDPAHKSNNESYLVKSIEDGVKAILIGKPSAIFGGRETLYFNIKRYGSHYFQLSEKLYTRYSAIAVQAGCPFLDSLNENIMRLFEAGILDKMTSSEYELMFSFQSLTSTAEENSSASSSKIKETETTILEPLNLRVLQGAFLMLCFGSCLAGVILFCEIHCERRTTKRCIQKLRDSMKRNCKAIHSKARKLVQIVQMRTLQMLDQMTQ